MTDGVSELLSRMVLSIERFPLVCESFGRKRRNAVDTTGVERKGSVIVLSIVVVVAAKGKPGVFI